MPATITGIDRMFHVDLILHTWCNWCRRFHPWRRYHFSFRLSRLVVKTWKIQNLKMKMTVNNLKRKESRLELNTIETFSTSHANAKRNVKHKSLHLRLCWSLSPVFCIKSQTKLLVSVVSKDTTVIPNVFCWVLRFMSQMLKVSNAHW